MSEKKIQDELKDSVHKIWLAGLGALSTAEEEGSKLFKNLVERGEGWESKSKERWQDVTEGVKSKIDETTDKAKHEAEGAWEKMEGRIEGAVSSAFKKAGVPTRDEIATLTKRVDELIDVVNKMQEKKKEEKKTGAKAAS